MPGLPWLNKKLADLLKQHSQWTSPTIQNEILNIVAGKVLQYITDEVRKAGPFSVIADGTADISREELIGHLPALHYQRDHQRKVLR